MAYADVRIEFVPVGDSGEMFTYVRTWALDSEGISKEQLDAAVSNMDRSRNTRATIPDDLFAALRGLAR